VKFPLARCESGAADGRRHPHPGAHRSDLLFIAQPARSLMATNINRVGLISKIRRRQVWATRAQRNRNDIRVSC
jgi:hypothetical protein